MPDTYILGINYILLTQKQYHMLYCIFNSPITRIAQGVINQILKVEGLCFQNIYKKCMAFKSRFIKKPKYLPD